MPVHCSSAVGGGAVVTYQTLREQQKREKSILVT